MVSLLPRLTLFDRYALRTVAVPLAATLAVGLIAPSCVRLLIFLDLALDREDGISLIFRLLSYWMPHYTSVALPVALLIGLLAGLDRLTSDRELHVVQACGVGLHQMFRPILILAVIVCTLSFFVSGWVAPYALYGYRALIHEVTHSSTLLLVKDGKFITSQNHTFMLEDVERSQNTFERLFVFIEPGEDTQDGPITITAERGGLLDQPGSRENAKLNLLDGVRLTLDAWPDPDASVEMPEPRVVLFDRAITEISPSAPEALAPRGLDWPGEWTISEIISALNRGKELRVRLVRLRSDLHLRLSHVALAWLLPFMALPFATVVAPKTRLLRFAVAVAMVVAVYQMLFHADIITTRNNLSPYLTMWLPMSVFAALVYWRYWRRCFVVRAGVSQKAYRWFVDNALPERWRLAASP